MIKSFSANKLILNLDKTNTKFVVNNSPHSALDIGCKENYIYRRDGKYKISWMQTDKHLNWKDHNEELIPKLSAGCYAVRFTVHISNICYSLTWKVKVKQLSQIAFVLRWSWW